MLPTPVLMPTIVIEDALKSWQRGQYVAKPLPCHHRVGRHHSTLRPSRPPGMPPGRLDVSPVVGCGHHGLSSLKEWNHLGSDHSWCHPRRRRTISCCPCICPAAEPSGKTN